MAAKKREAAKPKRSARVSDHQRIVDLAAELQVVRDRLDAFTLAAPPPSPPSPPVDAIDELRALGGELTRLVDEVRAGELDRAKLVAMAAAIARIATLIAAVSGAT